MKRFSRKALLSLPLSAALVLAACGGENEEVPNNNNGENSANEENNVVEDDNNTSDDETDVDIDEEAGTEADPDEVVATVNDEEIIMGDLQQILAPQMAQIEQMQGQMEEEQMEQMLVQVQNQALDQLVNQELLLQTANEYDIQVDEETVESQLDQTIAQFEDEEQFEQALESENLTLEELETSFREQIIIQNFLTLDHLDDDEITVSEEDVQTLYDQAAAQNPEIGKFEDVKAEMKQQAKSQQYIQQLREEADIDILI